MDTVTQWQRIWADNSDPYDVNRGILSFARTLFPDTIKDYYDTPHIHMELCREFLLLYSSEKRFLPERQLQEIVFRGASKSTWSAFIWPLYVTCYNGKDIILPNGEHVVLREDLIVIASETNTMATIWTMRIRNQLSGNRHLVSVFGRMKPESLRDDEGRWRVDSFLVRRRYLPAPYTGKNVSILSRGVGQQIRGINLDGRITLAIVDDIYSRNNIKTVESRGNIAYWYGAELTNSIDQNDGKLICIGTVVHDDTVIVANSKSRDYTTIMYPVMDRDKFQYVLDNYCKVDRDARTCDIPTSGQCEELEKQGYVTHWPLRFPLELLLLKFRGAIEYTGAMTESMFWQEYFHLTVSEADKVIRRDMIRHVDMELVETQIKGSWISFIKIGNDYRNVNTAIGIDTASSFKTGRDPTAMNWVAKDTSNRVYVYRSISGRYGASDEYLPQYEDSYLTSLCTDKTHIARIGCVNEIFRWVHNTNHRPKVVVEVHNVGSEVSRQISSKRRLYGIPLTIVEVAQSLKKEERIVDVLSPYYQSKMILHNRGQSELANQLEFLGSSAHDDEADILATVVANLTKPSEKIEWVEEPPVQVNKPFRMPSFLKIVPSDKGKWRIT